VKELSVEDALKELTSFEGVGLKTAACVLLFSFKMEVFPVDTHIHRILNRIGIVKTKSPEQTFWLSQKFIPEGKAYSFHTGLIKLGRMICRAHKPLCGVCPVYDECEFEGRKLYAKHSGAGRGRLDEFILLDNLKPKFKTKGGR
jgi:endonuclease-3